MTIQIESALAAGALRGRGTARLRSWLGAIVALLMLTSGGCFTPVLAPGELTASERDFARARARRDLGINYLSKGRNAIALRELLFAERIDPNDAITLLWMGEGYRRQGHNDKALGYMLRAVELQPDFQSAHQNLSAFYLQLEQYESASYHAQILIDDPLNPQPWTAFSNLGWAQYKLGNLGAARENLEMALDFRREFWPASLNLGILEKDAGHELKAIEHFVRVIEHPIGGAPESEANYRIGEVYIGLGHRRKAVRFFAASVVSEPESTWADQSRRYLKILR